MDQSGEQNILSTFSTKWRGENVPTAVPSLMFRQNQ
jgi:hypothetical protein